MVCRCKNKSGVTLVELLVVIAIMGILSAMGYAGLQGAVENNRVKDASLNITAFLNRVAVKSTQMSDTLCLRLSGSRRIEVVHSSCAKMNANKPAIDYFELDSPMEFVASCSSFGCDDDDGCGVNWLDGTNGQFIPKFGLSAAPVSGYVCARYGAAKTSVNDNHYAAALKIKSENTIRAKTAYGSDWD